jgi:hypothetical protein
MALGAASLVALAVLKYMGLKFTPPDVVQDEYVRLI